MLYSMKPILEKAREGNYGVAAPNALDHRCVDTIIDVAEKKKAPIIIGIGFHAPDGKDFDLKELVAYAAKKARTATVPIAINLDHGGPYEEIVQAINMEFSSVMIDRSTLPFEKNIKEVAEIVKIAHALGKSVEAELGHVGSNSGTEIEGPAGGNITMLKQADVRATFTKVDEAVEFVERTKVDCLAVAVGTVHGLYPKSFEPDIDFELLAELRQKVKIPLVMHGGSGSGDENLSHSCKIGICKINVFSDLIKRGRDYVKNGWPDEPEDMMQKVLFPFPQFYAGYGDMLEYYIELFGSDGKA